MTDNLLTRSITALRFPLSIGIVLLHTIIIGQSYPNGIRIEYGQYFLLDVVEYVSQREIGDIAVPLFFFISGYLFFYQVDFTLDVYKKKLQKRIKSLLLPYILWNTLWLILTWSIYYFKPTLFSSTNNVFDNFNVYSIINGYVGYPIAPFLSPLWFIRDLMFINIFAYPLFYLLRKFDYVLIPFLLSLFILKIWYEAPFWGTRSWSMYALGAWFAIKKKNIVCELYPHKMYILACFVLLIIIRTILHFNQMETTFVGQIELLAGLFSLILIAAICVEKMSKTHAERCAKASFFVYASHMFVINLPNKLWVCLIPANALTASVAQLTIPVVVGFFLYYIFVVLSELSPKYMAILLGGR